MQLKVQCVAVIFYLFLRLFFLNMRRTADERSLIFAQQELLDCYGGRTSPRACACLCLCLRLRLGLCAAVSFTCRGKISGTPTLPSASLGCISIPRESVSSFSFLIFFFFVVALPVLSQKCTNALNAICSHYNSFSRSPRMFFTVLDGFVHSLLTLTPSTPGFDLLEWLRLTAGAGGLEVCCSD